MDESTYRLEVLKLKKMNSDQLNVFLNVFRLERSSGNDWRATSVHLKGSNRRNLLKIKCKLILKLKCKLRFN